MARRRGQWCKGVIGVLLAGEILAGTAAGAQPPPRPTPPAPEMRDGVLDSLDRMLQDVVALRAIATARLTAADITAALPILRTMNAAQETLHQRAAQMLKAERQALLTIRPDGPLPPDSGEKIRQELARYRNIESRQWTMLVQAIGAEKAEALRRMINGSRPPVPPGPLPLPEAPLPGRPKVGEAVRGPIGRPLLEPHLALSELISLLQERLAGIRNKPQ